MGVHAYCEHCGLVIVRRDDEWVHLWNDAVRCQVTNAEPRR